MKIRLSDLWRWDGELDRGTYVFWGALLFAVKYNLDRLVARFFGWHWPILGYWRLGGMPADESSLAGNELFYATMVAAALPFIWMGVVLTLRRLRSVGLPLWIVVLFFVPFVNLFFFVLLTVLPTRRAGGGPKVNGRVLLAHFIPRSRLGSALMAVAVTALCGVKWAVLGTLWLKSYGWGLFVGIPFALGLFAVLIYGYHARRGYWESLAVSIYSMLLAGGLLLILALEGVVCLLMAAPLALVLAILGGTIGHIILTGTWWRREADRVFCAAFVALPALMGWERLDSPPAPLLMVSTSVEINASREKVWPQVIGFPELPPPREWLFRAGMAYPVRAEIKGQGAGAIRHCVFSTGAFVEPIQVWDEPRMLKFFVTDNPAPMHELTFYKGVHPPHLSGFLAAQAGQFHLTPLPDGRTRLEGTTWYRHHMWPARYWRLWSDHIIQRIHLRVLNHIKSRAETTGAESVASSGKPIP